MELQEIRDQVLLATLPHVAFEGWSERALRAGIAESGLAEADASLAFTGGAPEMIAHWSAWADRQMLAAVQPLPEPDEAPRESPDESPGGELQQPALSTGDRIAAAVMARIEVNAPWREAVRRTVCMLALPNNAPLAARSTFATVDAIWYACGDTATDVSYYGKRATLTAIYGATVLYWLDDQSDDFADTRGFLDRRLRDIARVPRLQHKATELLSRVLPPWRGLWPGPGRAHGA